MLHVAVDLLEAAPGRAQVAVVVGLVDALDHRVVLLLEEQHEGLHLVAVKVRLRVRVRVKGEGSRPGFGFGFGSGSGIGMGLGLRVRVFRVRRTSLIAMGPCVLPCSPSRLGPTPSRNRCGGRVG